MNLGPWMNSNLGTQGYCLTREESQGLAVGLRFPTGVCLVLVATGIALESVVLLGALGLIGAVAGVARRHPFDYVWNNTVRHVLRAPAVPPSPARRRHAFKLASVMLLGVAALFATGLTTAGLVLGGMLLAACTVVTAVNFCIPSAAMALWARHRPREARAS